MEMSSELHLHFVSLKKMQVHLSSLFSLLNVNRPIQATLCPFEEFGSYMSETSVADFVADVMDCAMSKI